jgi:hypothetical protein
LSPGEKLSLGRLMADSVIAYHASVQDALPAFVPLTHFGSREAALHRARGLAQTGRPVTLYEVRLSLGTIRQISDLPSGDRSAHHSWLRLTDHLHYDTRPRIISASERERILGAAAPAGANSPAGITALVTILRTHGIDTLAYANRFEDPGSISWIITDPAQVAIIRHNRL